MQKTGRPFIRGIALLVGISLWAGCSDSSSEKRGEQGKQKELAMPRYVKAKKKSYSPGKTSSFKALPLSEDNSDGEALFVACDAELSNPDRVLDLASQHYQNGDFASANACAQLATDLIPQAVEAQHLRAAALSALGRFDEAQVAFAMALLLDPDDPETLADVADFYINILPPKRRQTIQVGLEYARRGGQKALARRRLDSGLRGRLLLLEAEALNDLSNPVLALPRASEAMQLAPGLVDAEAEFAVSLFRLLRFEDSEKSFLSVLSKNPNTAMAHHYLGLILERKGRQADADAHFLRARSLAPDEYFMPTLLSVTAFQTEVDLAVQQLPAELQVLVKEAKVEIRDLPEAEDLAAGNPPFTPTILGLFRGLPIGAESGSLPYQPTLRGRKSNETNRVIVLYRLNLGRASRTRTELNQQIRKTLRHEIGHLQGYDEDALRRLGLE